MISQSSIGPEKSFSKCFSYNSVVFFYFSHRSINFFSSLNIMEEVSHKKAWVKCTLNFGKFHNVPHPYSHS